MACAVVKCAYAPPPPDPLPVCLLLVVVLMLVPLRLLALVVYGLFRLITDEIYADVDDTPSYISNVVQPAASGLNFQQPSWRATIATAATTRTSAFYLILIFTDLPVSSQQPVRFSLLPAASCFKLQAA